MIMKKSEADAVKADMRLFFRCPSCGELIQGTHSLREHWKSENYEEASEYADFEKYKRAAAYEYLAHRGKGVKAFGVKKEN